MAIYTFLDPTIPAWSTQIDDLCVRLGAPHNDALFPMQFLKVALPAIGGKVMIVGPESAPSAAGLLFPRDFASGRPSYTLRYHQVVGAEAVAIDGLVEAARIALNADIVPYDPHAEHHYLATHYDAGTCDIGAPDAAEAASIPALQREIWGAGPGFLYPADLHSSEFRPGTALVARVEGQLAGVLFGFYRFDEHEPTAWWGDQRADLLIESQVMGIAPQFRRLGIGFLLKLRQMALALEAGIDIIHWTVDPLQYPNGLLNFTKLGAVAFDFYPNYYPFRNALNQVAASRFRLTWLLRSPHVIRRIAAGGERPQSLNRFPDAQVFLEGATLGKQPNTPFIAIEIPADWTALQASDLERAIRWRTTSDAIFSQLIGIGPGKYAIIDVVADGTRRYLIGRRCEDATALFEDM